MRLTLLLLVVALCGGSATADDTWAGRVREGSLELRVGQVWTVALSTDVKAVVSRLGPGSIDALIDASHASDERLVGGAMWILCQLSAPSARSACTNYDSPPKPTVQATPYYPSDAFWRGLQGTVDVRILIGSSGSVVHAEVVKSVKGLDASAVHCVRRWQFEPAMRNGKAVPSVATAPVTFRITRD